MAVRRGPGEPLWTGSPGAPLPSFAALRKKVAPAGAKHPPSKLPSRRSAQSSGPLRIRRLPLRFATLVTSPPAGLFLCRQRKRRKKPPKGTYFEAVPSGLLPRRPRGLRPPLDSLGFTRDERRGTKDERRGFGRELRIAAPVCPLARNDGRRLHFAARSCEYTKTPLTYPVRGVISFLSRWR